MQIPQLEQSGWQLTGSYTAQQSGEAVCVFVHRHTNGDRINVTLTWPQVFATTARNIFHLLGLTKSWWWPKETQVDMWCKEAGQ